MSCIGDCRQGRDPCETPELCSETILDRWIVAFVGMLSVAVTVAIAVMVWSWL